VSSNLLGHSDTGDSVGTAHTSEVSEPMKEVGFRGRRVWLRLASGGVDRTGCQSRKKRGALVSSPSLGQNS
jgi:hypothetical protein